MSASIPTPENSIDITMANLNEQVGEQVNAYLEHLDNNPDSDLLTDLQSTLVDVIAVATVAYIAADKLIEQGGDDAAQDA
ncbi:MAG: hypothetical protein LC687_00615 [Actinobacteria bacterium]|nr:hypothetical protein [Actinomycetota bacterium]MCA1806369.1 hypothetical protein [Actinomycetota bacterium]